MQRWPIPVERYRVKGLPESLDALIVTSDLQGVDRDDVPVSERRLIGHAVAEHLEELCHQGALPAPRRCGVILAGDLYAVPSLDRRGGLGDVCQVWRALRAPFAWAAGVAGNHDAFGSECDLSALEDIAGCYGLDESVIELNGLKIAGISGILGASTKPWRRAPERFERAIAELLDCRPDLLVLHHAPQRPGDESSGSAQIAAAIARHEHGAEALIVCGHVHWESPLHKLGSGAWALNVDHRVVVLERAATTR